MQLAAASALSACGLFVPRSCPALRCSYTLGVPTHTDPNRGWLKYYASIVLAMPLSETLQRLPPAATDLARSIFDHHWREASWLYERRAVLYTQGALLSTKGWLELEARTDTHVRALALGDALVYDECEHKALEGDVGELHTAIRLLCRGDRSDRFNALVDRLDWAESIR